jgi:Ethanolamine utilization protein EutJ (predicted chaperonin)
MVDPIGDLDANTTIIVPVKITLKKRTKRSFACRMSLIYHYFCGDVHSSSIGISIIGGCGIDVSGAIDVSGGVDVSGGIDVSGGVDVSGGDYGWSKNFIVI